MPSCMTETAASTSPRRSAPHAWRALSAFDPATRRKYATVRAGVPNVVGDSPPLVRLMGCSPARARTARAVCSFRSDQWRGPAARVSGGRRELRVEARERDSRRLRRSRPRSRGGPRARGSDVGLPRAARHDRRLGAKRVQEQLGLLGAIRRRRRRRRTRPSPPSIRPPTASASDIPTTTAFAPSADQLRGVGPRARPRRSEGARDPPHGSAARMICIASLIAVRSGAPRELGPAAGDAGARPRRGAGRTRARARTGSPPGARLRPPKRRGAGRRAAVGAGPGRAPRSEPSAMTASASRVRLVTGGEQLEPGHVGGELAAGRP